MKKNKTWKWDLKCEETFESLKKIVIEEPILILLDYIKAHEAHIDASDFALGDRLMQLGALLPLRARSSMRLRRVILSMRKN